MALIRILVAGLALFAAGCVSTPAGPVWPYPEPPGSSPAPARSQTPDQGSGADPVSSNPAAAALVEQARNESAAGQLERAAATLERALRLAPQDPVPWLELARLRFEQSNLIQAESLARRSLSFAGGQAGVAAAAWELIADIKGLQGDTAAEMEARERARRGPG